MAVAIAFGSRGEAASTSSVATITSLTFNAEASDRILVADVSFEASSSAKSTSSVTIGGVTATRRSTRAQGLVLAEQWVAAVPTGTTGTVVVTLASGDVRVATAIHSVTGANETPVDSDDAGGTGADVSIASLTIPTGGAGLANFCNATSATAVSWTGADETHDTAITTTQTYRHSSAIVTVEGTNTITAQGQNGAAQALVGIAFEPASGGGPIEGSAAQTLGAFTQTAASALEIKAAASQTVGVFTQTSASKLKIKGVA